MIGFARDGLQKVVEDFSVLLLLPRGEQERLLHDVQIRLFRRRRRKGVAVSRLALARKCAHQVFLRNAVLKLYHVFPSWSPVLYAGAEKLIRSIYTNHE